MYLLINDKSEGKKITHKFTEIPSDHVLPIVFFFNSLLALAVLFLFIYYKLIQLLL